MKKNRLFFVIFLALGFVVNGFSLSPVEAEGMSESAAKANRRTALRCLTQASYNVSTGNWNGAVSQATLGLYYDDSLSDLYYLIAISKHSMNALPAEVLPYVETALEKENWVDYNRDGARILYADLLCDTGRFAEVSKVLDSAPVLFSADAEYIRAKSLYRIGGNENFVRAREKIDSARKLYPLDTRFPLLFFKYESPEDNNSEVVRMTQVFLNQIAQYVEAAPDKDAELEIYACTFAQGETQEHLLKSFSARHLRHPLYAKTALCAGLMNDRKAFTYFSDFLKEGVSYEMTEDLVSLITDADVVEQIKLYFEQFEGIFLQDTDGDGIDNMYVKYYRGRPETIAYDKNQDGVFEWTIICDFGEPVSGNLSSEHMEYKWDNFPYLKTVVYKNEKGNELYSYNLVSEELKWTPVRIEKDNIISSATGFDFYYPVVNVEAELITSQQLFDASATIELPSTERKNALIKFMVLGSHIVSANYTDNGVLYAQAQFENDMPVMRIVDADGDGVFETTEFYAVDSDNVMEVHSLEDERSIMTNLFGSASTAAQFYLRMVQIDTNADTVPDFTEEYIAHGAKISSWDTDGDGLWNMRYVKYPLDPEKGLVEDSMFYDHTGTNLVTVTSMNGIPVSVSSSNEILSVTKSSVYDFYWIGLVGSARQAKKCLEALGNRQGISIFVTDDQYSIQCIRIGSTCYGKIISEVKD